MKPPNKIYLQWYVDDPEYGMEFGRTWCQDKINDDDVEYILASRVEELEAALRAIARLPKYYPPMSPERIVNDMQQVAKQALEVENV